MTPDGFPEWYPNNCGKNTSMNIGGMNEEKRFECTVQATARVLLASQKGKITGEDFAQGLAQNAQHLGLTEGQLLDLVNSCISEQEQSSGIEKE